MTIIAGCGIAEHQASEHDGIHTFCTAAEQPRVKYGEALR